MWGIFVLWQVLKIYRQLTVRQWCDVDDGRLKSNVKRRKSVETKAEYSDDVLLIYMQTLTQDYSGHALMMRTSDT